MFGVALTFDDGPDPVWTPRLLDVLKQFNVRATFFPIARRAAASPMLIDRMLGDGHAIGLHCHAHVRHINRSAGWLRRDTSEALALLSSVGVDPQLWRPPWGITAPWTETVAREHGLKLVGWTVDTHDWRGDRAEEMLDATRRSLEDGAIVLAHDGIGPGARRETAEETIRYVELATALAGERGLAFQALVVGADVPERRLPRTTLADARFTG